MTFQPQSQIMNEIGKWGEQSGKEIVEAFWYEGDWSVWAQVELALYFRDFENVVVSRNQRIGSEGITADLLLQISGAKDVAINLVCETLPPGTGAKGQPDIWNRIEGCYQAMRGMSSETVRPVAMGLLVSDIACDNARYNLCDKNLFDLQALYTAKTGSKVNLFFRWI